MTTRRTLLRASLLAPAAGTLLARGARAAEPYRVGFVYVSPLADAGWTHQHDLGRQAVDAMFGDKVKTSYVENVPEGADAERVIRKMAADGDQMIFTTSFGFMNPTLKVAAQFPKAKFCHATGYKRADNVSTYSIRFYEGRYVAGILAGRMSKSGILGYVGAFPIPEVIQGVNAMLLGARSVNPKAEIKVVWTSSWFDPGKERAAADTMIAQGADVVTHHTDSTAVVQAGEEKGVWAIGYDSDMRKYAPKWQLTAVTFDWTSYYTGAVKKGMDGTWVSDDFWGGFYDNMIVLAPLNEAVPASVAAEVKTATDAIAAGTLKPFTGPVKDQSGATKIAAGQTLPEKDVEEMKWFVEGVQGKI